MRRRDVVRGIAGRSRAGRGWRGSGLPAPLDLRDQRHHVALAQRSAGAGAEAVDADGVPAVGQAGLVQNLLDGRAGVGLDLVGGRAELQDLDLHGSLRWVVKRGLVFPRLFVFY